MSRQGRRDLRNFPPPCASPASFSRASWLVRHYEAGGLALLPWAKLLVGSTLILGLLTRLSAAGALLIEAQPLFTTGLQLGIISQPELAWVGAGRSRRREGTPP